MPAAPIVCMGRSHPRRKAKADNDKSSHHAGSPEGSGTRGSSRRASHGAGRGIWNGSISFGLLQIPVTIYSAESRAEELHFRLLDKRDLSPVKYERVSSSSGKKVEWKDIVKGYEIEKDNFVVVEPEDFEKANVKATKTIDIQDFVPASQIDPAYFETPYFVVPQERATKAYVLLRDALAKKNAVAVATFVLRTREHLVALLPVGDAIMLETLRFGHELKDAEDLPLPGSSGDESVTVSEKELAMAEQLIDGMMSEWEPKKYKDRYYRDVMKIIEEKSQNGVATEHHTKTRGTIANDVVDLFALLKKSVASPANDSRAHRPGTKKAHPRTRTTATARRTSKKRRKAA
jgi:DNA end-binding protein Ku